MIVLVDASALTVACPAPTNLIDSFPNLIALCSASRANFCPVNFNTLILFLPVLSVESTVVKLILSAAWKPIFDVEVILFTFTPLALVCEKSIETVTTPGVEPLPYENSAPSNLVSGLI